MDNTIGLQCRNDVIAPVQLSHTVRTAEKRPVLRDDVTQVNAALYAQNRVHWTSSAAVRRDCFRAST
jgi:hypothetical protein